MKNVRSRLLLFLTSSICITLIGVSILLLVSSISGCDPFADLCANEIVQEVAAPDGRYKAILFERDCGATTGFYSQVSIIKAGEKLKGIGNTFVADDDHGATHATKWGGPPVELQWQSQDQLLITYDGKARVFKNETRVNGIKIVYRTRKDW